MSLDLSSGCLQVDVLDEYTSRRIGGRRHAGLAVTLCSHMSIDWMTSRRRLEATSQRQAMQLTSQAIVREIWQARWQTWLWMMYELRQCLDACTATDKGTVADCN